MIDYEQLYSNLMQQDVEEKQQDKERGSSNFLPLAFLPQGNHKGKIVADPESFTYYLQDIHQIKDIIEDKNWFQCAGTDAVCKWVAEDYDARWRAARRTVTKIYFHLIETDNPSDYWQAGNTYLVIGGRKLGKNIKTYVSNLIKGDRSWGALFDPKVEKAGVIVIDHSKSNTSVSYLPNGISPIVDTDESWYKPLRKAFIDADVTLDAEIYEKLVEGLKLRVHDVSEKTMEEASTTKKLSDVTPEEVKKEEDTEKKAEKKETKKEKKTKTETKQEIKQEEKIEEKGAEADAGDVKVGAESEMITITSPDGEKYTIAKGVHPGCLGKFNTKNQDCLQNKCTVNLACIKKKGGV